MKRKTKFVKLHPVRINGRQFICRYTRGKFAICREIIDRWTEGTTWASQWGVPYEVDVWLAGHYAPYRKDDPKQYRQPEKSEISQC